ncbi:MAG: hypothetical protein M5R40_17340 [Anaerolineae bacterium]|nr:hypothetical protein [Anaerolineae bacterium]
MFGEIADLATLVRAAQLLQAEGLRYALEANRRRKYRNSGALPWQFNEPYPMAACTSAVDYYARPKPAYYAVAQAYAPLHVSARFPTLAWAGRDHFEAELWLNNSRPEALAGARLTARLVELDDRAAAVWSQAVAADANAATPLLALDCPLDRVDGPAFFLDLALADAQGQPLTANRYVFTRAANLAPLLAAPPTALDVRREEHGDAWALTLTATGSHAALFAWLEDARPVDAAGYVAFSANHFCLLPGEARTVTVTWQGVPAPERRIAISGWNFDGLLAHL